MNETAERRLKHVPKQYQTLYRKVQEAKAPRSLAIKVMCLECVGWIKKEVRGCTAEACPLFRFRPYQKKAKKNGSVRALRGPEAPSTGKVLLGSVCREGEAAEGAGEIPGEARSEGAGECGG